MKKIHEIKFDANGPDALVCLNSLLPPRRTFDLFGGIPIIAADGAALLLKEIGIKPNFIIGDLDSFDEADNSEFFSNTRIIHLPDQESNDFEKILRFAIDKIWLKIMIFGFHGGLLEHTLNNQSVFKRYSRKMELCILDNDRYAISVSSGFKLECKQKEIISLIPQSSAKIISKGLNWELNNEILEIGKREGARNYAAKNIIEIDVREGSLLCFFDARLPKMPSGISKI